MTISVIEYFGQDALNFAEQNLRKIKTDTSKWEIEYLDEKSGEIWILDYPDSAQQGGGIPRLKLQSR